MVLYILIAYFVLNLGIGLVLHLRTSIRTLERPKTMELVVYFVVMLLIGLPLFLVTRITGGSVAAPGSPDLEIVPNPTDKR